VRVLIRLIISVLMFGGIAPCVAATPDPVDLRIALATAHVVSVLQDMTEAARNSDVGKYMTFVSDRDPLLLAEQRAWATNLRKKPPTEFSFTLAEGVEVTPDEDHHDGATADVTLAWTPAPDPEHSGNQPEPISVTFPARFAPQTDHAAVLDSRWVFAGVAWEVELTAPDGSRVLCMEPDREEGERLLAILPAALASAAACFEADTPVATVKLYPTLDLLNASISPGLTSPIAGWNDPGESIKLGAPAVGRDAEMILVHEAAHVAQFTLGPKPHDAPWWVLEGSAERAAAMAGPGEDPTRVFMQTMTDGRVRGWAQRGRLADWGDLAVYDERMPAGVERAYIQGHHMIAYLDETYSAAARNVWLRLLLNGTPIDAASREAFGTDFDSIDQSWRATLADDDDDAGSADAGSADTDAAGSPGSPDSPVP
jgi:hypothetical protein